MAKGNNTVKPKRSHLYKPYDSANSSLVSRLTNRVSEILPQPSSWLTRWLTPAEQDNFRSENEEGETSGEQQPPPTKRLRMQPSSNDVAPPHSNHVRNRIGGGLEPELSPILRSRSDQPDGVVAGPSGLHLRGSNFVASTPAAQVPTEPPVKVNGDECSDGSESTSGCSSLVPQGERTLTAPFPENTSKASPETPKLSITPNNLGAVGDVDGRPELPVTFHVEKHETNSNATPKTWKVTSGRRLSIKPRNRTMDLSTSLSRSRPSFDPYAFNNPLNMSSSSFNSSVNRTLNDSSGSPFYRGRTMYGGNSSCKESLSLSVTSPRVGTPRLVSVRPTSTPARDRDTISTSALRILKALEQYSTPVSDMKKVPVRSESERRKRKAPPQPFEDLVIPSMPDLLRIKRKERAASESSSSAVPSSSSAASTPKPYQLPPPVQPLSVRDDVPEPKRVMKGKHVEEMTSERVETVNLPSVPLPITNLPSFNLSSLPKSTPSLMAPVPPTPSFTVAPVPTFKAAPTVPPSVTSKMDKRVNQTKSYKFSQPSVESNVQPITSIKPALKFREPMDAETAWKPGLVKATTAARSDPPPAHKPNSTVSMNFQSSHSTFQPKLKKPEEKASTGFLKTSVDNNAGSITDFLSKDKPKPKEDKALPKPLSELFKQPTGSWTCQQCLVPNPADKDMCSCCQCPRTDKKEPQQENTWSCSKCSGKNKETTKVCPCGLKKGEKPVQNSWGDLVKVPSDTWECQACLVRNKNVDSSCVSCSTAKPGAAKPAESKKPDLSSMFKKPEGNWECSACLVSNKSSDSACVSCTTPKPGATNLEAPGASKPEAPGAKDNSWGNMFKKPEGNWDCSECLVSNKSSDASCVACSTRKPGAAFAFGIPSGSTTAATTATTTSTSTSASMKPGATFSFGMPASHKPEGKPSSGFGGFNFGIPKADDKKDKPSAANFTFGAAPPTQKRSDPDVIEIADDDETDRPPKKRVSFGDPLVQEKTTNETPKSVPQFSFGGAKSDRQTAGFTFGAGISAKPAANIFGSTSDAASSSTDAKSSSDKFGAGAVSSNVSSSTDKSDKPQANETKPMAPFTFGGSAAPNQTPFSAEKKPEVSFGPPAGNLFPSSSADKPFTFGSVNDSAAAATTADASKVDGPSTNIFGKKENQTLFGMPAPSEVKASGFFNSTENKTGPFNVETTEKNIFGGSAKPAFGASNSVFDMKPAATVNNTGFNVTPVAVATVFGSQTAPMNNAEKSVGFGTAQSAPSTPFVFKGPESTPKPTFAFPAAPNPVMNAAPNPFGGFNSEAPKFGATQPNAVPINSAQPAPVFGAPSATPMFNSPSPSPFAFGAPQPEQQQQPPQAQHGFGFGTAQPQAAGTPFTFNAISAPAPSQPPTFDPNVKPTFNFTGGSTPNFAAPPSTSAEVKPPADRKIRRAVRRNVPR